MLSLLSAAPARMRQKEVDALWWLYEHTAGKPAITVVGPGSSTDLHVGCRFTEKRWALSNNEGPDPADGVVSTTSARERILRNASTTGGSSATSTPS